MSNNSIEECLQPGMQKNSIFEHEFVKYFIAGCIAFGLDFITLYICTEYFGLHYLISGILGYVAGLVTSYFLNIKWVFSFRKYTNKVSIEFSIFNVIVLVGLLLNELIIYVAVDNFETSYLYGKIFSGFIIFIFNYIAKKLILFNDSQ